jgi:fermentation-respiration switch protein FrsA (DUF1100 family)
VLVAACSGGGDETSDETSTTLAESSEGAAPEIERLDGDTDEFYVVPDPLPPGEPGDVIRTMPVEAPAGQVGLRVMYLSDDAEGDVRAVTGLIFHPTGEAPDGGWPVLAWAHGTSGLAARCAPSRSGGPPPAFGVEGVTVATDYIGLGPAGEIHPYLSAAAEGHAVIDGVAAARALPEVGAGDEWVVTGVSQGGHAALVTGEMAAERLPEATLLGTVAIAPGSELGTTHGDELQIKIITTMVLVGLAAEDPTVEVADYLSPAAAEAAQVIETGCMGEIIETMPGAAAAPDYFTTDPRTAPVGEAWLEANDPGQVVSDAPLLVVQGGRDILVVPARTDALIERECGIGQVVDLLEVPEGDHDTVTGLAEDDIAAWVADRFAGEEPTTICD